MLGRVACGREDSYGDSQQEQRNSHGGIVAGSKQAARPKRVAVRAKGDVDADEEGPGGEDAADCLRYLVATKSRTITQRKLRGL